MPAPSSALSTLRPDLGTFFQFDPEMDRNGFIGSLVLPVVESQKASGTFGKISLAALLANRTTNRAPGTGYARQNWEFTPASFACEEHGAEEPIDDREAAMYADYFDAEAVATMRARDVVLRNYERRCNDLIFNTGTWTGASLATSVSVPWTTIATATPLTDVEAAVQKVYDNSGLRANALVLSWKAFRAVRRCAQILDLVKYNGLMDVRSGNITAEAMAQCFGLEKVIVGGASRNSAIEGQTGTAAQIWTATMAMVCRVSDSADMRDPCIGRTIHWGEDGSSIGGTVESYRDETVRSDVIRCRMDTDELVMYTQAGHLLTAVTA